MANIRPFIDTLRELEHGNLLDDLAQEQHRVIQRVLETNATSELTLTLRYKVVGPGQVTIAAAIKEKPPGFSRGQSLFFITADGNPSRNNPKQPQLPFGRSEAAPTPTNTEVNSNG